MLKAPTVINIKDAPVGWRNNADYVYIGRPNKWGNPFVIGKDGNREQVCEKYFLWLNEGPGCFLNTKELTGKTLVCYCRPQMCHGDVLVQTWLSELC